MKQFKIIFIIVLISCTSCDGGLWIKGNIVDVSDRAVNNCILELHSGSDSRPFYNRKIDSEFDMMLTISPGTHKYFFVIQCGNDFYSYKSEVYEIGAIEYIKNPLNLGKIILKKKTN